jgi:dihydropteroate synthase
LAQKFDHFHKNNMKLSTGKGIIHLDKPVVMGVLNLTPDSFYDGGRFPDERAWLDRTGKMLDEGATIIDIGGSSTRPGSKEISTGEELKRLLPALNAITSHYPNAVISVDTYRSPVAEACIAAGASIINDISGGRFDGGMFPLVARLKVAYIMMHILGTPADMQLKPEYVDVVAEVKDFFESGLNKLTELGVAGNVVVDPGFGFGKSVAHNFELLNRLSEFRVLGCPVMAGLSRKSMINRIIGTRPGEALNGTTALNTIALLNGADILRVHDVREAIEVIKLVDFYKSNQ